MNLIHIKDLSRYFKILNRRAGLIVAFYLAQLFLRPEDVSPLIYFSPVVGLGLFALTYWIWLKGVNSYTGTGA